MAGEDAEAATVADTALRAIELLPGNHRSDLTALAELRERIEDSLHRNDPDE